MRVGGERVQRGWGPTSVPRALMQTSYKAWPGSGICAELQPLKLDVRAGLGSSLRSLPPQALFSSWPHRKGPSVHLCFQAPRATSACLAPLFL